MLYKIAPHGDFYELTLKAQNEREATLLHDRVACEIARSSEFIGNVYTACLGGVEVVEGEVPLSDMALECRYRSPAEVKVMKRLLQVAQAVMARCEIADDLEDALLGEFDNAIDDAERFLFPEDDDPRSMGWVGDGWLP